MVDGLAAAPGGIFFGAKDQANGGVVVSTSHFVFVHSDVHIHLADVAVIQLVGFQVNQDAALLTATAARWRACSSTSQMRS